MNSDKVVPIGNSGISARSIDGQVKARKLLDSCRDIAVRQLKTLLQRMLDNADDALFAKADKAESNAAQTEYFDSMRIVRLHRSEIERNFYQQIGNGFDDFWKQPSQPPPQDDSEYSLENLSLMEETDLEESLAINNLAIKIKNNFGQEIGAIEQRLGHLVPNIEVNDTNNPVSPKFICQCFNKATQDMDTELKIKLIIYKLFDHQLAADIGPMYDQINQTLIQAGVLPELKTRLRQSTLPHVATSAPLMIPGSMDFPPQAGAGGYVDSGDGGAFLSNLQQLLSSQRANASGIFANAGGAVPFAGTNLPPSSAPPPSTEQILAALSGIQQQPLNYAEGNAALVVSQNIRSAMGVQLGVAEGQSIAFGGVDNDMVDVVAMMFEYILDDPNLPDAARALIGRLQIPMLKVAIIDKSFFASKTHPARKLLNQLAEAGLGMDEETETDNRGPLYLIMESIVNRVLDEFKNDLALFEDLLQELVEFQSQHQLKEQSAQEKTRQHYETREQQELARSWVRETLKESLQDKPMPKEVLKIIMGPWHDVMTHTYLNGGDHSMLWKNQLRFIDVLAWSVQPKQLKVDRKKLGRIICHLMGSLREGLQAIDYPAEKIARIFDAIEPYHHASLFGVGVASPVVNTQPSRPNNDHSADDTPSSDDDFSEDTAQIEIDGDTPSPDSVAASIEKMEQQMATLAELEAMLDEPVVSLDNEQDVETEGFDREIMEDIVLAGWDVEDHSAADQPEDEYLELARHLEAGKWVEFFDDKTDKKVRAKLSWKSDLLGEYTFTNWKFDIVADKTVYGLAADLRRGSARIIDDVPILDRALSSVMNGLARQTG